MSSQDDRRRPPTLRSLRSRSASPVSPPTREDPYAPTDDPELGLWPVGALSGQWETVRRALLRAGQEWDPGRNEVLVVRTRQQVVELAQWSPAAPQPLADALPHFAEAVAETMNYRFQLWPLSNRHHVGVLTGVGNRDRTLAQARTAFTQMAELGLRIDRSAITDVRIGAAVLGDSTTAEGRLTHPDLAVVNCAELALAHTTDAAPFVAYSTAIGRSAASSSDLALELAEALARDDVHLAYQLRRSMSGAAVGVEALSRWFHWYKGLITNDDLLGVAEQSGQLPELGRRLRLKAAQSFQYWSDEGLVKGRELYCNVAPVELCHRTFQSAIREIQRLFPTLQLHLELADSPVLDLAPVRRALASLADMGCGLILDGVGPYSMSIERLRSLPIVGVNLDGSFTRLSAQDKLVNHLADVVVELAEQRNLIVTACQVDSREQHKVAEIYGVDQIQGDLYAPPLPEPQFVETIRSEGDSDRTSEATTSPA